MSTAKVERARKLAGIEVAYAVTAETIEHERNQRIPQMSARCAYCDGLGMVGNRTHSMTLYDGGPRVSVHPNDCWAALRDAVDRAMVDRVVTVKRTR